MRADDRRAEGWDKKEVKKKPRQESDGGSERPPTEKVVHFNPPTSWKFPPWTPRLCPCAVNVFSGKGEELQANQKIRCI